MYCSLPLGDASFNQSQLPCDIRLGMFYHQPEEKQALRSNTVNHFLELVLQYCTWKLVNSPSLHLHHKSVHLACFTLSFHTSLCFILQGSFSMYIYSYIYIFIIIGLLQFYIQCKKMLFKNKLTETITVQ